MKRLVAALTACSALCLGQAWAQTASLPSPSGAPASSNPEMQRLFDEDQADRRGDATALDWGQITLHDGPRRTAVAKLLEAGALRTGQDFLQAAFVFQHGRAPNDFLLAHTLAMVAVAKGERSALWIASASLDRYLQAIERPQIFGTQYDIPGQGEPSQGLYDRDLVADALRLELGVPSQAEQASRLAAYRREAASQRRR